MDSRVAALLTEFIEKVGLLRRDLQHKGDLATYEARFTRIDQKLLALVEEIALTDPDVAKSLRSVWQLPARSLAFRNAEHKKERPQTTDSGLPDAKDRSREPEQ